MKQNPKILHQFNVTFNALADYPEIQHFLSKYVELANTGQLELSQLTHCREGILTLTDYNPKRFPTDLAKLTTLLYMEEISNGAGLHHN